MVCPKAELEIRQPLEYPSIIGKLIIKCSVAVFNSSQFMILRYGCFAVPFNKLPRGLGKTGVGDAVIQS